MKDGSARVEFEVRYPQRARGSARGSKPASTKAPDDGPAAPPLRPAPPRLPKITRLLVLGHHFERLVRDGIVEDYASLARLTSLSKTRVTQLVNLTLLAPYIQAEILMLDEDTGVRYPTFERQLRELTALSEWNEQRRARAASHSRR